MIELVTHVYAKKLSQYAVFLRVQLTSLLLNPPNRDFQISICYCPDDDEVRYTVEYFKRTTIRNNIELLPMNEKDLFRRAIGRNHFAKKTKADLVWFTDVDHFWGEHCLDQLWHIWWDQAEHGTPCLFYPTTVQVPLNHRKSDIWTKKQLESGELAIKPPTDMLEFEPKRYNRAIGGVQISEGDFVRKHGYLEGTKWLRPARGDKPFPCFRDDVRFRKFCEKELGSKGIKLDGVYRLRHSEVTYKGGR